MEPTWVSECGTVRLWLADCRDVLGTLPSGSVDAVVTDYPYGVGLTKKTNDFRDSKHFDNGESLRASVTYEDSRDYVRELVRSSMPENLRVAARALVFSGVRMLHDYPPPDSIGCVFTPNGAGRDRWGFGCFHPMLFYGPCPYMAIGRGSRPNSFSDNQPNRDIVDHPCRKPLPWMLWCVRRASASDGDLILDPLMGSGTTGEACVRLGRRFLGIEREPKYFAIAQRRIQAALNSQPLFKGETKEHQSSLWE